MTSSTTTDSCETLDREHFYASIDDALGDINATLGRDEPAP